ncbi:MAG: hypothetical protein AAGE03_02705 [Pseudomonadota bacterium]
MTADVPPTDLSFPEHDVLPSEDEEDEGVFAPGKTGSGKSFATPPKGFRKSRVQNASAGPEKGR